MVNPFEVFPPLIKKKPTVLQVWWSQVIRDRWLYFMLIPVLAWFIVFSYVPMAGILIAFKDFNIFKGFLDSPWVGLAHFHRFFSDPYFGRLLANTLQINIFGLLFGFPIPIMIAIAFHEIKAIKFKKVTQTISYLPYFISTVVVVSITLQILSPSSGLINSIIVALGFEPVYFLQKPEFFQPILITMGIWQGSGFAAIIYLAALSAIPPEQYEAADIDGANKFQQMVHITIPSIIPTIVIMLILNLGSLFTVGHERIILLYNPLVYETADVLNSYIYRLGINQAEYSYTTAVSLFQNAIGFLLVIGSNSISKRLTGTSLW